MHPPDMTASQVRQAEPSEVVSFYDEGRNVDVSHHRNAIANAMDRIGELLGKVQQLENRIYELESRSN
jgi:hypothetical protein